jgi:hypothetical protein
MMGNRNNQRQQRVNWSRFIGRMCLWTAAIAMILLGVAMLTLCHEAPRPHP